MDFVAKRGSSIGLYRVFIPVSIYISVQSTFIKVVLGVSVWSSYLRGGVCFVLGAGPFSKPTWSPNLSEFKRRFDSEMTRGRGSATSYSSSWREQDLPYCYCFFFLPQGPGWLKNLYMIYLLSLRAIVKAGSYLEKETFYTGNDEEDRRVKEDVLQLIESAR